MLPVNHLYCRDAMKVLRRLPSACIEAVVSDTMYGTNQLYDWGRDPGGGDPVRHWNYHRRYYEECLRVLRPGGVLCWGQGLLHHRHFSDWFKGHQVWGLCRYTRRGTLATANIWVVQRREQVPIPYPQALPFVVADRDDYLAAKAHHPCPKALEEMLWLLRHLTEPGQVILDPFAGVGSTLVAAKRLHLKWIGIEKSPAYCAVAKRRLADVQRFAPPSYGSDWPGHA
jgi:site-specific DNA-methyltransferase (adenine-specific)